MYRQACNLSEAILQSSLIDVVWLVVLILPLPPLISVGFVLALQELNMDYFLELHYTLFAKGYYWFIHVHSDIPTSLLFSG